MKNKWLLIALAAIGAVAIIGTGVAIGVFWGSQWFRGGGFGHMQWDSTPRFGRGMMWGSGWQPGNGTSSRVLSIEEAEIAINEYIEDYGSSEELHIGEIMIFDNHAYAEVVEEDNGIGAFEILVDPDTLTVYPEMGPNMMWNLKYGHMRGGMMGGGYRDSGVEMPISGEDAVSIANEYLSENDSDLTADGHPDPFYGYYTIHTNKNGNVYGMLSVNGYDGRVFLHTWHGDFIEMSAHEEGHGDL